MSSVQGGWQISDRSVSLGTKRVHYGQTGARCSNGGGVTQNSDYKYPSHSTWSYAVPSAWVAVDTKNATTRVGNTSRTELVRNQSRWTVELTNNI